MQLKKKFLTSKKKIEAKCMQSKILLKENFFKMLFYIEKFAVVFINEIAMQYVSVRILKMIIVLVCIFIVHFFGSVSYRG